MTDKRDEDILEALDAKFTLKTADGNFRRLPQHEFVMAEIQKALATVRQQGIAEGERRERERVMTKFCNYVKSNWYASLGYGEKKDMEIFESAIEEFSWLEIDKQQILQTLTNDRY